MANSFVPIYILRSRCLAHGIDTMRMFTLKGNESPDEAYKQMEAWVTARWPKTHDCEHKPEFIREIETEYRYSTKKKKAVKI